MRSARCNIASRALLAFEISQKNPLLFSLTSRRAALKSRSLRSGAVSVSFAPAMNVLRETNFPGLAPSARGKVRDIYDLGDKLLIVATDRLSAFDVVMPTPIPDKGRVLNQLSLFWFDLLRNVIPNHVWSATGFPAPFDK